MNYSKNTLVIVNLTDTGDRQRETLNEVLNTKPLSVEEYDNYSGYYLLVGYTPEQKKELNKHAFYFSKTKTGLECVLVKSQYLRPYQPKEYFCSIDDIKED